MNTGAGLVGRANRTALFIGAIAAVSTIAIGIGLVFFATAGGDRDGGSDSAGAARSEASSTSSSRSSATTTTAAPAVSTTTTTAGVLPNSGQAGGGALAPDRAYSDPEDPPYEAVLLPAGIGAQLTSCSWNAANGGELEASGTITASPETDDSWFVDVYWLQNERELDSQFELFEIAPGETKPWRLTAQAPLPPAEPFRCALEIS